MKRPIFVTGREGLGRLRRGLDQLNRRGSWRIRHISSQTSSRSTDSLSFNELLKVCKGSHWGNISMKDLTMMIDGELEHLQLSDHSGHSDSSSSISSSECSDPLELDDLDGGRVHEITGYSSGPRVPLELQEVFLRSQRGETVNEPPPLSKASFTRKWWNWGSNPHRAIDTRAETTGVMESQSSNSAYPWMRKGCERLLARKNRTEDCVEMTTSQPGTTTLPSSPISKPAPLLKTRVPIELQEVFLRSQRGETVDKPPSSGTAFRVFGRPVFSKKGKGKKAVLSFGGESTIEFDHRLPTSTRLEQPRTSTKPSRRSRWASPDTSRSHSMPKQPRRGNCATSSTSPDVPPSTSIQEDRSVGSVTSSTSDTWSCPTSRLTFNGTLLHCTRCTECSTQSHCPDRDTCTRRSTGPRLPRRGKSPLRDRVDRIQPHMRSFVDLCVS